MSFEKKEEQKIEVKQDTLSNDISREEIIDIKNSGLCTQVGEAANFGDGNLQYLKNENKLPQEITEYDLEDVLDENNSPALYDLSVTDPGNTYSYNVTVTQKRIKKTNDYIILYQEENGKNFMYVYKGKNNNSSNSSSGTENTEETVQSTETGIEETKHTFAYELRSFVFNAYRAIRVIATVGMMSVLVYIGIRIVISSAASEKAKYKELLGDWLVGMVLLFTMHYIMYFSNIAVEELSKFLNSINPTSYVAAVQDTVKDEAGEETETGEETTTESEPIKGKIREKLEEYNFEFIDTDGQPTNGAVNDKGIYDRRKLYYVTDKDGSKYIEWRTDLMGLMRMSASYGAFKEEGGVGYIGYTILFLIMFIYTLTFIFVYIKRIIYMAFLTIIAPLVALTYPIDKVTDGKAQGFNYWFKEYIFNLLLQPMHLFLYTLLISATYEFSTRNPIYCLVAIGFIGQAEKIVRKMFNFEKASTPGVLAGPVGAALTFTGLRKLLGRTPQGGRSGGGSGGGDSDGEENSNELVAGSKPNIRDNLNGLGIEEGTEVIPVKAGEGRRQQKKGKNGNSNGSVARALSAMETDTANPGGESTSSTVSDGEKKKRPIRSALADGFGYYKDGMKRKFTRKLENARPLRQLARMTAGAAGAVAIGSIGLAAGVASGDPSKALQYAGVAATGGYRLGGNLLDKGRETFGVAGFSDQMKRSVLGEEEYKRQKVEKNRKRFMESEDNIRALMSKYNMTRSEAKDWLKEKSEKYMDNGIDNISDMMDIQNTIGSSKKYTDRNNKEQIVTIGNVDQAIGAYKVGKMFDTEHVYGKKKSNEIISELEAAGFSPEMAEGTFYASQISSDKKNNRYVEPQKTRKEIAAAKDPLAKEQKRVQKMKNRNIQKRDQARNKNKYEHMPPPPDSPIRQKM